MANVLYAYDKKDVEKMIDLVITRIRKGDGIESSSETDNEKLTQKQAALFLGVSVTTIINYRKERGLPFYKIGKPIFYFKKELIAFGRVQNDSQKTKRQL
jgi:hypothetical protein